MQQQVIELGKALVKELDVEPEVDTLTRWITHYIAELLKKVEAAEGKAKEESQSMCFEAILTLWHHRAYYHDGHRPFENFEPIFRVLESLNPEDERHFYFSKMGNVPKSINLEPSNIQEWIDVLRRTDELARILISYSLQKATSEAVDEETIEWLSKSISLIRDDDLEVIVKLVESNPIASRNIESLKGNEKKQLKELNLKLEKLNEFIKISDIIKTGMLNDIDALSKKAD